MSYDNGNGDDYERGRRHGERRSDKRIKAWIAVGMAALLGAYGVFEMYLQIFDPLNPHAGADEAENELVLLFSAGLLAYIGVDTLKGRK